MVENQDILLSVSGQSLSFDCPEGTPSSITSSMVYESSGSDTAPVTSCLDGSAAIATTSATISATSGDGQQYPNRLNIESPVGLEIDGYYLVTNTAGEQERFQIASLTDTLITTRHPLRNVYAADDLVTATGISQDILDAWTSDSDNLGQSPSPRYRWVLEYVVDSKTYRHVTYFDLVRYSTKPSITIGDVARAYPWLNIEDSLSTTNGDDDDQGKLLIKEAYRQVKLDLASINLSDEGQRNTGVFNDLLIHKAASLIVEPDINGESAPMRSYNHRFNTFVEAAKLHFDSGNDGSADKPKRTRLWTR